MIVGVSDENESLIEDYIAKKGVQFGILRAQGGLQAYGGRGYPTFVTIAPDGTVAQYGGVPTDETIQSRLAEVQLTPEMPDDSAFKRLRKAWEGEDFAKVQKELAKGLEKYSDDPERLQAFTDLQAAFDKLVESTQRSIEKLGNGPDFLRSQKRLEQIVDQYDGLPVAELAEAQLDRFKDDEKIQNELEAGEMLDLVTRRYDASKSSDRKKMVAALTQLIDRFPGTYAAERAAGLRTQVASQR